MRKTPELTRYPRCLPLTRAPQASAITHKIGYPLSPNTEDPAALARYYALNLPIDQSDYFGNVLRSRLADQRRLWVKVGRPRDVDEWEMVPSEVNAYYSRELGRLLLQNLREGS